MKSILAAIIGITFVLILSSLVFASAELEIRQVKYDPFPAEAGNYFDLFINVKNVGFSEAVDVACELIPQYPFSLDPNEDAIHHVGKLAIFDEALFEYKVRTDANAVEGDNELELRCGTKGLGSSTVTKTLTINIDANHPEFAVGLIKSIPDELKADQDDVRLTVEVQNVGEGDAKLVTSELILPEGFEPSSSFSNAYSLGTLDKDSAKEAVFFIDIGEVTSGVHQATLNIKYKDSNNNQNDFRTQSLVLPLNIKSSPRFVIEEIRAGVDTSSKGFTGYAVKGGEVISPSNLRQGGKGELRITVLNSGEEEAESVSLKIFEDSQNIPISFDEIFDFIGNLAPGESGDAVFSFSVNNDATLKEYLLETEVRFIDGNNVETDSFTIPMVIAQTGSENTMIIVIVIVIIIIAIVAWKKLR